MSVQWEAVREAAPVKVYPLATVLNPKPNRSIRKRSRGTMAVYYFAVCILAAFLLFL